jgi:selenocysteine lyase/cysteine desulfurase
MLQPGREGLRRHGGGRIVRQRRLIPPGSAHDRADVELSAQRPGRRFMDRRQALGALGGMAALAAGGDTSRLYASVPSTIPLPGSSAGPAGAPSGAVEFPRKADFAIPDGVTFINCAYTHPMPKGATEAVRRYLDRRSQPEADLPPGPAADLKAEFAALINAKPAEISYITNTSSGENLIVEGLGIRRFDGNVVTDALHFDGALVHLNELKKQGLDLRVVMARDGRIEMSDLERVVDRRTRLIEVSLVAMYNGFQHDLKAVSDLAHAHGAYVYADLVQAAGAVPIDVRATGVDFCACSSFKWLMGDFGAGFLYIREDLLDRVVARTHTSYHSTTAMDSHFPPFDPRSAEPVTWTMRADATGHFETGSTAQAAEAALRYSLPYIRQLGVENIQSYRQPILARIREGMTQLGFTPATPEGTTSPLITFATRDGPGVAEKLKRARVNARVADYWIRLSPSVFNDLGDVDRLLEALS